jgi:hypothetical protein
MEHDVHKEPWGLTREVILQTKPIAGGETVGIMVAQHGALAATESQHEVRKERFLRTTTSKNVRTEEQEAESEIL